MTPDDFINQLIRHEGLELKPYKCTAGKTTIGVGRNLDDVGITEEEARYLLNNDIVRSKAALETNFPEVLNLDSTRYYVLLNMAFNLGIRGLSKFQNMWTAIRAGDYNTAAVEMLDSTWARQVGNRAKELADQMRNGA